jgi:hypothetical protein
VADTGHKAGLMPGVMSVLPKVIVVVQKCMCTLSCLDTRLCRFLCDGAEVLRMRLEMYINGFEIRLCYVLTVMLGGATTISSNVTVSLQYLRQKTDRI